MLIIFPANPETYILKLCMKDDEDMNITYWSYSLAEPQTALPKKSIESNKSMLGSKRKSFRLLAMVNLPMSYGGLNWRSLCNTLEGGHFLIRSKKKQVSTKLSSNNFDSGSSWL